jgi:chromosome segregation ATPase
MDLEDMRSRIASMTAKRDALILSKLKSEIKSAKAKTEELGTLLQGLRAEPATLMSEHQKIFNAHTQIRQSCIAAGHSLRLMKHLKEQRKGEIEKLAVQQRVQLTALHDAVDDDRREKAMTLPHGYSARQSRTATGRSASVHVSRRAIRAAKVPPERIECPMVVETIRLG